MAANAATTTDAQTVYFGSLAGLAPGTTAALSRVYVPKAGAVKVAQIFMHSGTAGTNENITCNFRLNNTTNTLIQAVGTNTAVRTFQNTSLNISVSAGDYFEIQMVFPTWATNPANVRFGGHVYIE